MAQTDSRAGFRLPWSSERSTDATETSSSDVESTSGSGWGDAESAPRAKTDEASDEAAPMGLGWSQDRPAAAPADEAQSHEPEASRPTGTRRPSKFLADLTKAMQAAAEEARGLTLSQLQADAKNHIETVRERSATEAAALRRAADDDVAAVREWSKAEIARIRDETETRIIDRKGRLETEVEDHAALIEREIETVQRRVAAFEEEMADFFARLLAEEDPTRFATMAERLPEAPPFDEIAPAPFTASPEPVATAEPEVATEPPEAETAVEAEAAFGETDAEPVAGEIESAADEATPEGESLEAGAVDGAETEPEAQAETGAAEGAEDPGTDSAEAVDGYLTGAPAPEDFELDREAAFAAIQAAAEAAASAEVATDAADRAEAVADIALGIVGSHDDGEAEGHHTTDFDAAEAEAAATADATGEVEEIPVIGDEALAARLADLLPSNQHEKAGGQETRTTQVVVVGLVSVASIASFKRHLGRLAGVQSVGVSSGPDGEFLFAVHHGPDVVLRDAIPSMPSFQARVTGSGEGTLNVTAHDPESDN